MFFLAKVICCLRVSVYKELEKEIESQRLRSGVEALAEPEPAQESLAAQQPNDGGRAARPRREARPPSRYKGYICY